MFKFIELLFCILSKINYNGAQLRITCCEKYEEFFFEKKKNEDLVQSVNNMSIYIYIYISVTIIFHFFFIGLPSSSMCVIVNL